jgi:hypothetical protein
MAYGHVNPYGSFHLDLHRVCSSTRHASVHNLLEPKCYSATINSPDDDYFAAGGPNVGVGR